MKSRTLRNVLILALMLLGFNQVYAQTATPPAAGDGSAGNPYRIATLDNLYWLSQNSAEWDENYIQTADIDASATATWDDGDGGDAEGFSPIGNQPTPFTGSYDGDNHTISNLTINRPGTDPIGLFGCTGICTGDSPNGAAIQDLGLTNCSMSGSYFVGGLVGMNSYKSIVSNCYSTGSVSGTGNYVGGLVGRNSQKSIVSYCYSATSVSGDDRVGGLVGDNRQQSIVSNCHSKASVAGNICVGGLVGENSHNCNVSNCYSMASVTGTNNYVGGLVGSNNHTSNVSNCYSTSSVSGNGYVGGLVGYNSHNCNVSNCYTTTSMLVTGNYVGGLVGLNEHNCNVSNCCSSGSVSVTGDYVGGLVGLNCHKSNVSNSYSTTSVSGTNRVGGLVGGNSHNVNVSNSYSTASVAGSECVGGLVGFNGHQGNVSNSYSRASVSGDDRVGGLVGGNYAICFVSNCYSTGNVTGNTADVGGLVGYSYICDEVWFWGGGEPVVTASFWDTQTSGQATSVGGTGKTTVEMKNVATFTDLTTVGLTQAWDFINNPNDDTANDNYWGISALHNDGYPYLIRLAPFVLTIEATDIGQSSAILWGTIFNDFGQLSQARFCYWKSGDAVITNTSWTGQLSTGDQFSSVMAGLDPDTRYWFWAEAKNPAMQSDGWSSGVKCFTTLKEAIEVVTPQGGACLLAGGACGIEWLAGADINDVVLEYSLDAGATWNPIATVPNADPNKCCDWTVPVTDCQQCFVCVTDCNDPNCNSISGDGVVPFSITTHVVPDVVGMSKADAQAAINAAGLTVGTITYSYTAGMPAGKVMNQHPPKNTPVPGGSPVDLVISIGPEATAKPVAKTESATAVGSDTATLRGTITNDGGGACEYRFYFWKYGDMWISNTSWTGYAAGGQTFSHVLTGLTPGTQYWYWSEAKNTAGQSDGWSSGLRGFTTGN